jgi:hypothetical protein
MFDEEKAKKDILRMREAYDNALKKIEEVEKRQAKIAEKIYAARKNNSAKHNKILWA